MGRQQQHLAVAVSAAWPHALLTMRLPARLAKEACLLQQGLHHGLPGLLQDLARVLPLPGGSLPCCRH
jgi:hypothetical protein